MNMAAKAASAGYRAGSDSDDKDWTGIGLDASEAHREALGVPGTEQAVNQKPGERYCARVRRGTESTCTS
jgi:hypothetical protein